MFRIDNATAAVAPDTVPAPGTPGHFTGGNPAGGVGATIVDSWWAEQLQEELMAVLAAAGIAAAKGTNNQVIAALQAMFPTFAAMNAALAGVSPASLAYQLGQII